MPTCKLRSHTSRRWAKLLSSPPLGIKGKRQHGSIQGDRVGLRNAVEKRFHKPRNESLAFASDRERVRAHAKRGGPATRFRRQALERDGSVEMMRAGVLIRPSITVAVLASADRDRQIWRRPALATRVAVALAWAMRAAHRVGSTGSGGESGLNLFINDVKKIQVVEPPPLPQTSLSHELERLHNLLVRGAISQVEFDGLKATLLGNAPSR